MIKLADSKRQFKTTITHTGNDTGNFYPITHNLGTRDILITIYDPVEGVQMTAYGVIGSSNYGYGVNSLTDNSCSIHFFHWSASATPTNNSRTVNVTITAL